MKISVLVIGVVAMLVGGCASIDTVTGVNGHSVSRTYPYGYEPVFNATIASANAKELEVVDMDKRLGRLAFSHGINMWSLGERITVFFKAVTPQQTEVEIISKPVLSPLTYPPDWPQILHQLIGDKLQPEK